MKELPRLTAAIYDAAVRAAGGQGAGWWDLCRRGYMPEEVAMYAPGSHTPADVNVRVRDYCSARGLEIPATNAPRRVGRVRSAPPEDWREAFRGTVMKTGMVLTLTQPMLEMLCATADGVHWDRAGSSCLARPQNTLATAASLEKRGLMRRITDASRFEPKPGAPPPRDDAWGGVCYYELTEAGEHLIALLKSVGVFVEADRAIARKAASA